MKKIFIFLILISLILFGSAQVINLESEQGIKNIIQQIYEGNLTKFTELQDTPNNYSGEANNCVIVNSGETGLEFGSCAAGGAVSSVNSGNSYIIVNPTTGDVYVSLDTLILNSTIADYGVRVGFNSTFNSTYSLWAYNQTLPAIDYTQTYYYNQSESDERYLNSFLSLYFHNKTSPINPSYTNMNLTIDPVTMINTFSLSSGSNLLTPRLSQVNISVLPSGSYNQHINIQQTAGTKNVQLYSTLFKLNSSGETVIGNSSYSDIISVGSPQAIDWAGTIPDDVIFGSGEYLVMRLYAYVTGTGSDPTIVLRVGGTTAARLSLGVSPAEIKIEESDPIFTSWESSLPNYNLTVNAINYTKNNNYVFVWEGDSITAVEGEYPDILQNISGLFYQGKEVNIATTSQQVSQMISDYPTQARTQAKANNTAQKHYLSILAGINDLIIGGKNSTNIYDDLKTYWALARDDNFIVIAWTLTPANSTWLDSTKQSNWTDLNKLIRSDPSLYDYLIPADKILTNASDTNYYIDGLHPNAAGHMKLARGVLEALSQEEAFNRLCLNGLCVTNWSDVNITSSDGTGGWINSSIETNTTYNVNINSAKNLTIQDASGNYIKFFKTAVGGIPVYSVDGKAFNGIVSGWTLNNPLIYNSASQVVLTFLASDFTNNHYFKFDVNNPTNLNLTKAATSGTFGFENYGDVRISQNLTVGTNIIINNKICLNGVNCTSYLWNNGTATILT